jgi:hypothetical protein
MYDTPSSRAGRNKRYDALLAIALSRRLASPLSGDIARDTIGTVPAAGNLRGTPGSAGAPVVVVGGFASIGDGGGGVFYWSSLPGTDDGGTFFVPNGPGIGTVGPGWSRTYDGPIDIRWFGASTAAADNQPAIQRALDVAATGPFVVYFPTGTFRVASGLSTTVGVTLVGSGRGSTILKYTGAAVTSVLRYHGGACYDFAINGIGIDCQLINANVVLFHLQDVAYFSVADAACYCPSGTGVGTNGVIGLLVEVTGVGQTPPRGFGEIRDFLYTSETSPRTHAGSRGIHLKGFGAPGFGQNVVYVNIAGEINIEQAEYGILFEQTAHCSYVASGYLQGSYINVGLIGAQYNVLLNLAMGNIGQNGAGAPGVHLTLDAGSYDNTILFADFFNPNSGPNALSDLGTRNAFLGTGNTDGSSPSILRRLQLGSDGAGQGTPIVKHYSYLVPGGVAGFGFGAAIAAQGAEERLFVPENGTDIAPGDAVTATPDRPVGGPFMWQGRVSAPGTLALQLVNYSAAPSAPAAGVMWRLCVTKYP